VRALRDLLLPLPCAPSSSRESAAIVPSRAARPGRISSGARHFTRTPKEQLDALPAVSRAASSRVGRIGGERRGRRDLDAAHVGSSAPRANLFMLYGPNLDLGRSSSIAYMPETQIRRVLWAIALLRRGTCA
jgi:hypothetical protein